MSNPTGKGGFGERKHQINKNGRPKSFDALRELAQAIAHEAAIQKGGEPVVINGHKATITEVILRRWANSNDPKQQQAFIEIAYGKVPQRTEITGKDGQTLTIRYVNDWRGDPTTDATPGAASSNQ